MEIVFSATILFLSIYKLMYFIRIYDSGIEILTYIGWITHDLIPFATGTIILLFGLSMIYQVLHMGVNDPNGLYRFIGSDLMKLFMQTLKMSSGDNTPPSLDKQMEIRLEGRNAQTVFVFFLEIVWSLQQF